MFHADGRTDTHDAANKRFSQFCECAYKVGGLFQNNRSIPRIHISDGKKAIKVCEYVRHAKDKANQSVPNKSITASKKVNPALDRRYCTSTNYTITLTAWS